MGAATSRVHLPSAVYPPPTDKEAGHGVDLTGIVPGQPGARAHPLPASSSTEGQLNGYRRQRRSFPLRAGAEISA